MAMISKRGKMHVTIPRRVKSEFHKLLFAAIFFSVGFCIIIVHNRLLTEGSSIQIAGYGRAVIGGFIVAKVLLMVDVLPFVDIFPKKPLVYNIAWKSFLYVLVSLGVLYMDPLLTNLVKGVSFSLSTSRAWHELMLPRTWATMIWLAMLLLVFVAAQEMSRVLGKGQLECLFFGNRQVPAPEARFRDAA